MLVLLHIERVVVVPAKRHGEFQPLQTVLICAPVGAVTHCRVPVRNELIVIWSESLPSLIGTLLQNNYHEAAHQEGGVRLFVIVQARVVIDLVVLILLIVHKFLKLLAKQVHLA